MWRGPHDNSGEILHLAAIERCWQPKEQPPTFWDGGEVCAGAPVSPEVLAHRPVEERRRLRKQLLVGLGLVSACAKPLSPVGKLRRVLVVGPSPSPLSNIF